MYLKGICKISKSTHTPGITCNSNLQVQNQKQLQHPKTKKDDTKLNTSINLRTYSYSLLHNIILLSGLFLLLESGFSWPVFVSPSQHSLLGFQAAHLHQYPVEALRRTPSERNARFVLRSDELNSRWGNSGLRLDHCDHHPASHHLLGRGKNGLKKKR